MDHLLTITMFLANAITCGRLLCYRRAGARYRLAVSLAAWLLIVSTGSTVLSILLGLYPPNSIHLGDVGIAVVLCLLSLTARGNVAHILRTRHDSQP